MCWLLLGALGCGGNKESSAAPPPGGSSAGTGTNISTTPGDADMGDGGPAGAAPIGGAATELSFFECVPLVFGEAAPIMAPADFQPTHFFSGWLLDCTTPTLVFGLSEGECVRDDACAGDVFGSDEVCMTADAHRLAYFVEAAAILNNNVTFGPNVISADSGANGLSVRYRRPAGVDASGLYGNCEGSDGLLNIENIGTTNGTRVSVSFNHVLSSCGGLDRLGQTVTGAMQVTLVGGRTEACIGS